jgi:hypothetical protein
MLNSQVYRITSLAKGIGTSANLYLNAGVDGKLTVNYDGSLATSQWRLWYYPGVVSSAPMPGAVILVNVASDKVLTLSSENKLTMSAPTMIDDYHCWTIANPGAIRSAHDGGLNLNVEGSGPYNNGNSVIVYSWDFPSNNLNERWDFQAV